MIHADIVNLLRQVAAGDLDLYAAASDIEVALSDARDHAAHESPLIQTLDAIQAQLAEIKTLVAPKAPEWAEQMRAELSTAGAEECDRCGHWYPTGYACPCPPAEPRCIGWDCSAVIGHVAHCPCYDPHRPETVGIG